LEHKMRHSHFRRVNLEIPDRSESHHVLAVYDLVFEVTEQQFSDHLREFSFLP